MKNILEKTGFALCCFLGMWMGCGAVLIRAAEERRTDETPNIVTIDIPYSLFVSLVAYQELTEMENTGKTVNSEMIPVLENIVEYLRTERRKYENMNHSGMINFQYGKFLIRMDKHIDGFHRELIYRRRVAEYEALMEEQKKMIGK
ncbi:MAG: hypothetical protein AB7S75_11935 [Desulfococcaceae bacterium]